MKIRLFYHSLVSDWNHGNAHFLRGVTAELLRRGHDVVVYEPHDSWSRLSLVAEHGPAPLRRFAAVHPELRSIDYDLATVDLAEVLDGADLVIVHEWNDPALLRRIGELRRGPRARRHDFTLLFHDTHHRLVTQPEAMRAFDLAVCDGVLAYGRVLRDRYLAEALAPRAWTWHEAADTRRFRPRPDIAPDADLVWIGNWGDDERAEELHEFLIEPVRRLGLKARVHGVRYPDHARAALERAGIEYRGWLPNFDVPEVFARHRVTVHVPRRPYVRALPGIPTIRPFEALACGIPLVSAPWEDRENLFTPGRDFLVASDGSAMTRHLRHLLADEQWRRRFIDHGLATIRTRHTCAHRVDQLLAIHDLVRRERATHAHATAGEIIRLAPLLLPAGAAGAN